GRVRIDSMILHVDLGAGDEEGTSLRKTIQPPKIDIASIHDIDGSGLRLDQVQRPRIAHFTVGNMDKTWNRPTQIDQRVHLDRCLRGTEISPREQRQAQVDCRAVERIDGIVEIESNVVVYVKFARAADQNDRKVMPHAPVTHPVRIPKRRFSDRMTKAHTVKF